VLVSDKSEIVGAVHVTPGEIGRESCGVKHGKRFEDVGFGFDVDFVALGEGGNDEEGEDEDSFRHEDFLNNLYLTIYELIQR
jgi:hypothetical protein